MTRPLVLLSSNSAWNVANFRGGLCRALQDDGWDVLVAAPRDEHVPRVQALGCRWVDLPMANGRVDPLADLRLLRAYGALMDHERPAAMLGFTIKPNVYGSLAAHRRGIPVVNNIAGLGALFIKRTWLTAVARQLYGRALRRSHTVMFQNEDDRAMFTSLGLVQPERTLRVPGSGVDLARFRGDVALPASSPGAPVHFMLVGRMLVDKGVLEFVHNHFKPTM